MATNVAPQPYQHFSDDERLFHRVHRGNITRSGKASLLGFALPDMSVNRGKESSAEATRGNFNAGDWAVVAFLVQDIPPRTTWVQIAQQYFLKPRHIPVPRNFSHSEVRVWRKDQGVSTLITSREVLDFSQLDPDRDDPRDTPEKFLDPEFHMRWRKHIALASKMVLPCEPT
jgi:hypothetical protein